MGYSALQLALAISEAWRPEKDFYPAKSTSSPLKGTDTEMAWRHQWLVLALSPANHSSLSAVTYLADV